MPGVRTSQACELCKQRRKKCDQTWPTCSTCKAARRPCSGPSSLLQFIQNNKIISKYGPVTTGASNTSSEARPREVLPSVMVRRGRRNDNEHTSFQVFRLRAPRANPTTVADRISVRLVALLKYGQDSAVAMQVHYLQYLPQRLSQSDCLRDCTALFCSAWADYNRGKPLNQLLATAFYPKAIRSLQRTLNGPETYTVETLAAMSLFERTDALFRHGQSETVESHRRGIDHVFMGKGALNLDDKLDVALALGSQWDMQVSSLEGTQDPCETSSWKAALPEHGPVDLIAFVKGLECFREEHRTIDASIRRLCRGILEACKILMDPDGVFAQKDALIESMSTWDKLLQSAMEMPTAQIMAQGYLKEVPNPDFLLGKSFYFTSLRLATAIAGASSIRRIMSRVILDISALYGPPDAWMYQQYREACAENWMYLPYAASLDPLSAEYLTRVILPSLDGAEAGEEFDQLADLLFATDPYEHKFPRDKELLRAMITSMANENINIS